MIIEHFISGQRRFHKEKSSTKQSSTEQPIMSNGEISHRDTFEDTFYNFISSVKKNVFDHKFLSLIIFVLVLIIIIKSLK